MQAFLLEPLGKSSLKAPWMLVVSPVIALIQCQARLVPHVADVMPVMLLTEETGDNDSWTRHYSILSDVIPSVIALDLHVRTHNS